MQCKNVHLVVLFLMMYRTIDAEYDSNLFEAHHRLVS